MSWTLDNNLPIYTQILEQIQLRIISGYYKPGDKLPSVRDLATEAGVNPNTMQKACSELERSGLIVTKRTNGRNVTEDEQLISDCQKQLIRRELSQFIHRMKELSCQRDTVFSLLQQEWEEI